MLSIPSPKERIKLPGFGLPVNHLGGRGFPHAIVDSMSSKGLTLRERRMLDFISQISDKPKWNEKVFDEQIVEKWKKEAVHYDQELGEEYLSENMFNFCLEELRDKAKRFERTGFIPVMDAEVAVVKSDTVVPINLAEQLVEHVQALENVPDNKKDWHPDSNQRVLDLVHPSLFPLIYGKSRVLPYGTVPLVNCLEFIGKGEVANEFPDGDNMYHNMPLKWRYHYNIPPLRDGVDLPAWGKFQWLPTDLHFTSHGNEVKIASYINNLHPNEHHKLYEVLEKLVALSIPLWNEALSWTVLPDRIRIKINYCSFRDSYEKLPPYRDSPEGGDYDEWCRNYRAEYEEWLAGHRKLLPTDPEDFVPYETLMKRDGVNLVDLAEYSRETGLQVIFKLANIHLTPEKPRYEGGSWHIEGALNEHICATALYYYDQENISNSYLGFRQSIDREELTRKAAQEEYRAVEELYGVSQEGPALQDLGKVLTCQGRLLAFPNILQHRVFPFKLADPTQPGHRKILAMFLVDPHIRVLSTANVPPQRRDWWADALRNISPFNRLSEEVFQEIITKVDDFPMSWDKALSVRLDLMGERGRLDKEVTDNLKQQVFNFCEH